MTDTLRSLHDHDWRVLDLCRDYCRCGLMRRACPKGHRHVASVSGSSLTKLEARQ